MVESVVQDKEAEETMESEYRAGHAKRATDQQMVYKGQPAPIEEQEEEEEGGEEDDEESDEEQQEPYDEENQENDENAEERKEEDLVGTVELDLGRYKISGKRNGAEQYDQFSQEINDSGEKKHRHLKSEGKDAKESAEFDVAENERPEVEHVEVSRKGGKKKPGYRKWKVSDEESGGDDDVTVAKETGVEYEVNRLMRVSSMEERKKKKEKEKPSLASE